MTKTIERRIKILLILLWGISILLFYIIKSDAIETGTWRFMLNKIHLLHDFTMPYFTPARAGGFLLAADAQDMLFTVYMFMAFLIPNTIWAIKITNALLTVCLGMGVYVWLSYFGIKNKVSRLFAGILVSLSGYWLYHIAHIGHLWAHGLAYLPWVMVLIEDLLILKFSLQRKYLIKIGLLVFLSFLLINSGYYFLQTAIPIILFRLLVEIINAVIGRKKEFTPILVICCAGFLGIILSFLRLGGVYEFQLSKFPRLGDGFAGYIQIIGNTPLLIKMLFKSFFDGQLIIREIHSPAMLGFMWDYNNFIGIGALIAAVIGLKKIVKLSQSRAFWGLLLAVIGHLAVIRSTHIVDLVNIVMPIYRSITWHWRGNAILLFFVIVFVASGYEVLLSSRKMALGISLAVILMVGNFGEIIFTNLTRMELSLKPPLADITKDFPVPPEVPIKEQYNVCLLGGIFGYEQECPSNILSIRWDKNINFEAQEGYYNLHDVRQLASHEANGGYFMKNRWPLWPRSDKEDFERFINFKQVVKNSLRLEIINWICIVTWFFYLAAMLFVLIRMPRKAMGKGK